MALKQRGGGDGDPDTIGLRNGQVGKVNYYRNPSVTNHLLYVAMHILLIQKGILAHPHIPFSILILL